MMTRLTVFLAGERMTTWSVAMPEIGRLIPVVAETEQIRNRGNCLVKSRAQVFDGSARRFFVVHGKTLRWQIKAL